MIPKPIALEDTASRIAELRAKLASSRPLRGEAGRIIAFARPHSGSLVLALILLAGYTALGLSIPWAISSLLDEMLSTATFDDLALLDGFALALVLIFFLRALLIGLHAWLLARIGGRVVLQLRQQLFDHLTRLGPGFFDDRRVGGLVSRVMSDVAQIQSLVTNDLAALASSGLTFTGAAVILAWRSWRLSLVMLVIVPPLVLAGWAYGRRMRLRGEAVQDKTAEAAGVVEENLGAIRLVQAFVREPYVGEQFARAAESLYAAVMARVRTRAIFGSLMSFLTMSLLSLGLWLGSREVVSGIMSAGDLVGFLIYTSMLGSAAAGLVELYGRWANALGASRRVFEILDRKPSVISSPTARRFDRVAGRVSLAAVQFAYRSDLPVLHDVDLDIAAGETLALVGPSGAGKSTLMQLVARFYDPDKGRLCLDGIDLREIALPDLRRQIGWVPQETVLFNATVAQNLRFGSLDASEAELAHAARAANAHDFVTALPEGYATLVGERGVRLSAGQRQRLTIARALLSDPRVLLLDEATASLDSRSELLIQEALERLMAGRTTIVIAHRLATVQRADRIAVVDEGRIVELGPHAELVRAGGLYASLSRMQFRDPEVLADE